MRVLRLSDPGYKSNKAIILSGTLPCLISPRNHFPHGTLHGGFAPYTSRNCTSSPRSDSTLPPGRLQSCRRGFCERFGLGAIAKTEARKLVAMELNHKTKHTFEHINQFPRCISQPTPTIPCNINTIFIFSPLILFSSSLLWSYSLVSWSLPVLVLLPRWRRFFGEGQKMQANQFTCRLAPISKC